MRLSSRQLVFLRALRRYTLLNWSHIGALELHVGGVLVDGRSVSALVRRGLIVNATFTARPDDEGVGSVRAFALTLVGQAVLADFEARAEVKS